MMTIWNLELCFVGGGEPDSEYYDKERLIYQGNSISDLVRAAEENAYELDNSDAYYYLYSYGGYDCEEQIWTLDQFFDCLPDNITIMRHTLGKILLPQEGK